MMSTVERLALHYDNPWLSTLGDRPLYHHVSHGRKVSVIGLGYVGLPLAVAFGQSGSSVVAFDVKLDRIKQLWAGYDSTGEVEPEEMQAAHLWLTDNPEVLRDADFHIIAVPTPIDQFNQPDLGALRSATVVVGKRLKRGDIVSYESTVYPGATEEECIPLLELHSGLKLGRDFSVGYSPERINAGDKRHRLSTITKVVSASDPDTLDIVARVYGSVVRAGVYRASSIKVAEAAKVIENVQRDANIALMNELSQIFDRLGIDTGDVLDAAATKWNFARFSPGLVGGHCIGVDPYYLLHKAHTVGLQSPIIAASRSVNDGMGSYVARSVMRGMAQLQVGARPRVTVLGLTFKEDVPDIRNTRVVDIVAEFRSFGAEVQVADPIADPVEVMDEYGLTLLPENELLAADAIVLAVSHQNYRERGWSLVQRLLRNGGGFVADVKGALDRVSTPPGIILWRL